MTETLLEDSNRLSQSLLWKLQYDAYCQFGMEAWSQHGVPSYITSNTYIAKSYAHIILGYLRDCIAQASLQLEHPVYLLDLGAGTGRLAYFILKELLHFLSSSSLPHIKICYVMTEIASSNIDFWQQHPYLKPYFEQGVLDCAYYHHTQETPLHLRHRDEILTKETIVNPLILICNYFFDTIPQDLFRFKRGHLEEGQISLFVDGEAPAPLDPSVINRLQSRYTFQPTTSSLPYYQSPVLNTLLEDYSQGFEECPFLFPLGALEVLQKFSEASRSRFLLLAGDQGVCTPEQIRELGEPKLALHGSFSLSVNYHTLANFFEKQQGAAYLTSFPDPAFVVMAGVRGLDKTPETSLAFHDYLDRFEPADYFKFVTLTEDAWKEPPLDHILLLIKLGNWDASVLLDFFPLLQCAILSASPKQKKCLHDTIDLVWEHFYPTGPETGAFVFNLGLLLFDMKYFKEAKLYFERSLQISGINEIALKGLEACDQRLKDL